MMRVRLPKDRNQLDSLSFVNDETILIGIPVYRKDKRPSGRLKDLNWSSAFAKQKLGLVVINKVRVRFKAIFSIDYG